MNNFSVLIALCVGSLGIFGCSSFFTKSDTYQDKAQFLKEKLSEELEKYKKEKGAYPNKQIGLNALLNEGYLKNESALLDPWGKKWNYKYPGDNNKDSYDIWSYGGDAIQGGTEDNADVTNW